METKGYIHSIQSLGTVDGPGVRFVAFLSGCPLRCKCCHNPDTWEFGKGEQISALEIVKKAGKYRSYFGSRGGVTLSGGEPLCQADFVSEVFRLCHENGINTCLDTSGVCLDDGVKKALEHCDRVLLDLKYTNDEQYRENVGCSLDTVLHFLKYLNEKGIKTTLRQVIIPTVNDSDENLEELKRIAILHSCVEKIELLPFRKICQIKYDGMGLPFPFGSLPEADALSVRELEKSLNESIFK